MMISNPSANNQMLNLWRTWTLLAIAVGLSPIGAAGAKERVVDLSGFWELDTARSDDPEEIIKSLGKINKKKQKQTIDTDNGKRKPIGGDTYRRYWEHVSEDREWRKTADAAHGGTVRSILVNSRLAAAATEDGFKVWYQDGFVRDINPNPYGRIFSASGDELVTNDLGRTLSYEKKGKIISETRIKPRGEIVESFAIEDAGQTLVVKIKVDRPDWDKIIEVTQTYRKLDKATTQVDSES